MMKINYTGSIQILKTAVDAANELLAREDFYKAIAKKTGFYFTTATGSQVAASLHKCDLQLTVKTFKQFFTRKLGYEDPNDPTIIHINVAGNKLKRSMASIVGTFIHEAVHAADSDDEQLGYAHNGNLAAGNQDTAPYWIGNLAIEMVNNPGVPANVALMTNEAHAVTDKMMLNTALVAGGLGPELTEEANFYLSVTVLDGEQPPIDITVQIVGTNYQETFTSGSSIISKPYFLPKGAYDLTVTGANPDGGKTKVDIDGDFNGQPIPGKSDSRKSPTYSMPFSFVIN